MNPPCFTTNDGNSNIHTFVSCGVGQVFDVNDIDGVVVGIPPRDLSSGYYGWFQTSGPAAVLTNGTVVVGKNMMTGSTTDGSGDVMADDSSAEFLIGGVINVGATTEYSLVDLQIRF